jgi:hypothetical protein
MATNLKKQTPTTSSARQDFCDVCGSLPEDRSNVSESLSNKANGSSHLDASNGSYECIACNRPLQIPVNGIDLNQKLNNLFEVNSLLVEHVKIIQEYINNVRSEIFKIIKFTNNDLNDGEENSGFVDLEKCDWNKVFYSMTGKEYLNDTFTDLKLQVIKHELNAMNRISSKSRNLISKAENIRDLCLSKAKLIEDKNKSYFTEKIENFQTLNPDLNKLKEMQMKINSINLLKYKRDLRMKMNIRFVSSNDMNIFGKFKRKPTKNVFNLNEFYEGDVQNNKAHGYGVKTCLNNGTKYEGCFFDDKLHGFGSIYWSNGSKYVGEWRQNQMNGPGVLYIKNELKYKGYFLNGKRHGNGISYDVQGNGFEGVWINGELIKQ